MADSITVYCTKYALTRGIYLLKGKLRESGKYFSEDAGPGLGHFLNSKEFHLTKEAALADYHRRRAEKIASVRKQLTKLLNMQPLFEGEI
jgi:hypothetical protein